MNRCSLNGHCWAITCGSDIFNAIMVLEINETVFLMALQFGITIPHTFERFGT